MLASPVRNAKDLAQAASRKPLDLLKFAQVTPGMQVPDVGSGSSYTAQVLIEHATKPVIEPTI